MNRTLRNGLELSADEKRALLADLLRQKAARPKTAPTSFAQQRLWFLSRLEPDSPAYNIPRPLRLRGELNLPALQQTFNTIAARHEVLRGSLDLVDGHPVQMIAPRLDIELPVVDLTHLPAAAREAEVSRLTIADAQKAFDVTRAPLFRVTLLKLGDLDQVLLLTMHHIVSDGWSMGIFVKEMAAIYQALSRGEPVQLREPAIQYPDFARWQREWLQGEVLEEQLRYWTEHLTGAPAVLNLPVTKPRPAMQTFHGSHVTRALAPGLTDGLAALSRREGVTLFMTLLAAFKTLLFRYSGQEDLVVGSPIAGRNRAETEDLIGFFVNTLPLRSQLSGNPTFCDFLKRVRETALGAYAHQDLPFEKIVEGVQPPRSLSYPPIFQIMFALQNQPAVSFTLPGLEITGLKREFDTAKFDLTLFMTETEGRLGCWLEYNTDLFEENTVRRLLEHFEIMLAGIVANPDERLGQLPLLKESERQQLLVEWNDTTVDYAFECINLLFERQVERTPKAVAVVFENHELSYGELNRKANRFAHYLRERGVGPEILVGVCLERSSEMVVALLAILKAGGAYVPLDPEYPASRLALMLRDSAVAILLTQAGLRGRLPETQLPVIEVDGNSAQIAAASSDNPANVVQLDNLAYVIYTSGSTGQPKGTMNTHRGLSNRLLWMQEAYQLTARDRVLQKTPFSFDVSVWEFFWPLIAGARLVVARPAGHRDSSYLVNVIRKQAITTLHFVPSMLQAFLDENGVEQCQSVRQLISSGEALSFDLQQRFFKRMKGKLHNLYGPTEAAIDVTSWECAMNDAGGVVPIGRPIANLNIHILDAHFQPVPVGVAGELFIGGVGVGRGYLNRPDLTADKFIPDPLGGSGSRLYRTGDLARYREDGAIEYLGRLDHQVKVRGFRIELGEIEASLIQHEGVAECIVVDRDGGAGKQLVAYFTVNTGHEPNSEVLRDFLKAALPDYMVPTFFMPVERMPLTANGKIDQKALPEPVVTRHGGAGIAQPEDEIEFMLSRIWERVLNVRPIGLRDNFFELGGHSLLAVRLMSEIEREFGKRIQLVSLFQSATIEALAHILRQDAASLSWPTLIEIQAGGAHSPLFCISTPNVNALGYRSLARYLGPDQAVYGLQAQYPEDLEGEHSQAAVEEMAAEYLEVIRGVRPDGPYQLVGMCRGAHIAFEMARRLNHDGQEVAFLGILDTWVLENTYNKFLYVEYYARRLRSALRLGRREQLDFIKSKTLRKTNSDVRTTGADSAAVHRANPMRAYFPGPDFQPQTYPGRISVFRARKQPLNRIRDKELGWGKLARGGVDLHYISGTHGASLLSEPHVQILAADLKQCLLN